MASFPTSVKSWTALVDRSDYPQAAHVNEARDEINAIEAGYLNGTARLNSSNSTVANLGVTGHSTFSGDVSCTGTIGSSGARVKTLWVGQLEVSSLSGQRPHAKVTSSLTVDLTASQFNGLSWDTETVDPYGMHSTSANSSRLTFAESRGLYAVGAHVTWNAMSSGVRTLRLVLNNVDSFAGQSAPALVGLLHPQSVVGMVWVTSTTDYVTVQTYYNGGSTNSLSNSTTYGPHGFWAHLIST